MATTPPGPDTPPVVCGNPPVALVPPVFNNPPVETLHYADYEDAFRGPMIEAGLPVEKE